MRSVRPGAGTCRHHKRSDASIAGRLAARPRDDEARMSGLYGGRVRRLGWLTRERTVGGRRAPAAVDWLTALALVALALVEIAGGVFPGPVAVVVAVQVAGTLPVAFRRVAALPAIAVSSAVFLPYVVAFSGDFAAGGSVANAATELLLIYSVGRHTDGRRLLAGAVFALLLALEPGIGGGHTAPTDWAFDLIFGAVALGLGVALRIQTERSIALAVAAERTRGDQVAAAWTAVQEERGRIARELHDVVAHNVGLIVLQAGGARSVLAADPERARAALLQVEEMGRQTLDEMRRLVGILRVGERESTPASLDEASRRGSPSVLDWLVTIGLVILALAETANGVFPGPPWVAATVLVAGLLPVAFRRVAPLGAIAASTAIFLPWVLAVGAVSNMSQILAELLLVYAVGRHAAGRGLLAGSAIGLALFLVEGARGLLQTPGDLAYASILWGGALGLGVALRIQTERAVALAVAAEHARVDQEVTSRAAVQEERARIARELHDVVADKVGLIVLQAGGARSVLAMDPGRARKALQQVEETGRQTLAEMRHLVGILREVDGEERQPLPRLERLPVLLDEARAGGLTIEMTVEGAPVELPAGLELAIYRLIQEALTNVRKHAPASTVQVCLGYETDRLRVEVTDDGVPSGAPAEPEPKQAGLGHGLIGMRERVLLYGGRLQTGRMPGGGFRVEATLPVAGMPA
jgi:signal transduction histidine kinase